MQENEEFVHVRATMKLHRLLFQTQHVSGRPAVQHHSHYDYGSD